MTDESCCPPVVKSLSPIYGDSSEKMEARYDKIKLAFKEKFGREPEFFARAPGRVNLIGEHIDYCGYAVFPMALEQDIVIAASLNNDGKLNMSNTDESFGDFSTSASDYKIDGQNWFHYVLCGHKGIIEHLKIENPVGMNIIADGTVPKSAGLSSSSALVCCAGLATMFASGQKLSKYELADICTRCERYIGTQGGGMDQSISFLAERGTAKLIEFNPLKATDAKLPDGAVFVIANCLRDMKKSETAATHFNVRVAEDRVAGQVLAKLHGLNWKELRKLADVQKALGKSLQEMVDITKEKLHEEPYTRAEICKILEITEDEFIADCLSPRPVAVDAFKLHNRAVHVFSEANRVIQYKQVCDDNKPGSLKLLGDLMNESHKSCSEMYECSCDELDELTQLARHSGALGSRLSGAGWGGCTVSLVPGDKLESFLAKVKQGYYVGKPDREAKLAESLFATQPGSGAGSCKAVFQITDSWMKWKKSTSKRWLKSNVVAV
eukprot:gene18052-19861_t